MPILIIAAIAATILILASSMSVRTLLARIFTNVATAWNNNAPTWEDISAVLRSVGRILLIALVVFTAIFLALWFMFFIAMIGLGAYTGWWKSGILLGILFPIWLLFFISPKFMYRIPVLGKTMKFSRWVVTPVVVLCALFLTFGLVISPAFPLSTSLGGHTLLGYDIKIANWLSKPAVKARAIALAQQTAFEDEGAELVKKYYDEGKPREAINLLRDLTATGKMAREIISYDGSPRPQVPVAHAAEKVSAKVESTREAVAPQRVIEKIVYVPAATPAVYNPPAALEPDPIDISGKWTFNWGDAPSNFLIRKIGGGKFKGVGVYPDGGEMDLTITRRAGTFQGEWEIIGRPQHLKGSFDISSAGEYSGTGTWIHDAGNTSPLTIKRI